MATASTIAKTGASLQVFSTAPAAIEEDCTLIEWSRRSTDKTPVAAAERYRAIVIGKAAIKVPDDGAASKFQRLLQDAINGLADSMFQDWAKENMMVSTYNGAAITVDSVLNFWAEKKQREVIDGATITAWLLQSATFAALDEGKKAGWKTRIPKIAAPAYRNLFDKKAAAAIMSKMAEADAEHVVCAFIATRCNTILAADDEEL